MDLDTWVSLGSLVAVAIGLLTYLNRKFEQVDQRFDQQRAEFKADIADVKADLRRLDDRVYALAAGLRIDVVQATEPDAS